MKKKRIEEVLIWFKIKVDNEKEGTELIKKYWSKFLSKRYYSFAKYLNLPPR